MAYFGHESTGGSIVTFDPRTRVPIRTLPKTIEASCYNRVLLALARLGEPLEVELPTLRMSIRVERRWWLGRSLINDIPLMAWLEFQAGDRGLHEPVPCCLHIYHFHAGLLAGHAPQCLVSALEERLARWQGSGRHRVAPLVRKAGLPDGKRP